MPKTSKMHVYAGKLREDGALAYTDCIDCPERGNSCNADNFGALDGDSLRAIIILLMEYNGWSHAKTAEVADVPKGTFDNWISGITKELRWDTAYRIIRAVCDITPRAGDTCPLKSAAIKALKEKADAYDELLARFDRIVSDDRQKIDHLKEQVAFQKDQLLAKDNLLNERRDFLKRKDKVITVFSALLAIVVVAVIVLIIVDIRNPHIGYLNLG